MACRCCRLPPKPQPRWATPSISSWRPSGRLPRLARPAWCCPPHDLHRCVVWGGFSSLRGSPSLPHRGLGRTPTLFSSSSEPHAVVLPPCALSVLPLPFPAWCPFAYPDLPPQRHVACCNGSTSLPHAGPGRHPSRTSAPTPFSPGTSAWIVRPTGQTRRSFEATHPGDTRERSSPS